MTSAEFWIHPGMILLAGALLLPSLPARFKPTWLVAVPLLVEVIQIMTPASPQGQKAYQTLVELGFVTTPYAGATVPSGS